MRQYNYCSMSCLGVTLLHDEVFYSKLDESLSKLPDGTYSITLIEEDDDHVIFGVSSYVHYHLWQQLICKHLHLCIGGEWQDTALICIDSD